MSGKRIKELMVAASSARYHFRRVEGISGNDVRSVTGTIVFSCPAIEPAGRRRSANPATPAGSAQWVTPSRPAKRQNVLPPTAPVLTPNDKCPPPNPWPPNERRRRHRPDTCPSRQPRRSRQVCAMARLLNVYRATAATATGDERWWFRTANR